MMTIAGMPVYGVTEKVTRRLAAVVVGSQSVVVALGGLVAWAQDRDGGQSHPAYLVVGLGLMVACIVAAGSLRTPWGVTLGWLLQIATLVGALVVPMMLIVGLVFGALWLVALVQGPKMDRLTAEYVRSHG